MYKNKKFLAIIPARGGSKRLPGKNIKLLAGKPLLCWSIDSAKQSNVFSEIMVSTDSQVIADISEKYGASVPFLRDKKLGTDKASSIDVVVDSIEYFISQNQYFDVVVLLQPTSPLRDSADIINAVDLFIEKNAKSVLSVCEVDHPIQWCNSLNCSKSMDNFIKDEYKGQRSQDLEINYRLNGAIYIWDTTKILKEKKSILTPSFASVMERSHSIDIDEEIDLIIAEALIKR